MFYREAGQFKTTYGADQAVFPIAQDRIFIALVLFIAYAVVPFMANEYWLQAVLIPFLVFSLAAIGLNILTGYAGQISLGTGGFMAVGGYSTYKLVTAFPDLNIIVIFFLSGLIAAAVGILFGIPSLRIKGFYLAVATLAAQFFLTWMFNKVGWFYNHNPSGTIIVPPRELFGVIVVGPPATAEARYMMALVIVTVMAIFAKNLVRGRVGRLWMAIRDMDIAAEIIGIRPLRAKLSAFAVSSFYAGVAGALWAFLHLGAWEPLAFDINRSFLLLFMVIIGGLGSILGCFLGAAFILMVPLALNQIPTALGMPLSTAMISHLEFMIFGALIVFFLIVEPHGLARLWALAKEKLRLWPFPH